MVMEGYKVIDKNRLLGLVVDFPMLITFLTFSNVCIYQTRLTSEASETAADISLFLLSEVPGKR